MPNTQTNRIRTELYLTSKLRKNPRSGVYVWKRYNPETATYDHVECGAITTTGSAHELLLLGLSSGLASVEEGTAVTCVLSHPVIVRQLQNLAALERNGFKRFGKTIANIELWREVARLVSTRSVGFRLASKRGEDRRVMKDLIERANQALDASTAK